MDKFNKIYEIAKFICKHFDGLDPDNFIINMVNGECHWTFKYKDKDKKSFRLYACDIESLTKEYLIEIINKNKN
jgi:hypothetical protein